MKKVFSVFMSLILMLFMFSPCFGVFAAPLQEEWESKELTGFISGITQLAQEYDKGKDFVVPENDETAQIQTFSAENITDNSNSKYTLQDFQTARLIVRANGNFDNCNALEHISGFEDFHILQYESPEAAITAYEQYKTMSEIENVAPDEVVNALQDEGSDSELLDSDIIKNQKYLCQWGHDRTQADRLLDYIESSAIELNTVTVGIVDSGVDYNHEFLKSRIKRTYFNSSSNGNPNDEMDCEEAHGTAVSSVVADYSPDNVKIAVYRILNSEGWASVTQVCAGFLQAIADGVNIINASIGFSDHSGLVNKCVNKAYYENIPLFTAAGNEGKYAVYELPANVAECITVSATDANNTAVKFNSLTPKSDISAPGENVTVAALNNTYRLWSGTSFAAPCAAALGAVLKSVYPEITVDKIESQLKDTAYDVKRYGEYESSQGSNMDNYYSLLDGFGMIQFCDALGLENFTAPEINLEDKVYVGEQTCTITCDDKNATILYTTDGTYPDFENANVYTQPFQVTQRTRIRAVAYYQDSGYYSDEAEATPRIQYTDSDENFVIDNNGIITKYNGSISDLYVSEAINGITVRGFAKDSFNNLTGLTLPKTVTKIPEKSFYKNISLEFICAEGVTDIGEQSFENSQLMYAEFPTAKNMGNSAFAYTSRFCLGSFPNLEDMGRNAFMYSNIISFNCPNIKALYNGSFVWCARLESVYLPQCTEIIFTSSFEGTFYECSRLSVIEIPLLKCTYFYATFYDTGIMQSDFPFIEQISPRDFYDCSLLEIINMPSLLSVPEEAFNGRNNSGGTKPRLFRLDSATQIGQDAFGEYPTSRIEFSHLETAQSLPQTEGCIIAMPSTFKECTEDTVGRNYKVYGTKGTYAEQWANENGHEFINISQDTAILKDVPMEYTDKTQTLSPDVIGFNRTYQWYASDKPDNTAGTPIEGATDREFNSEDYPAAKYYYCVVTSTDVGYDPIEIRTGVTENTTLNPADYSKVEKAKSEIPENLSLYTDESVKALQDILDNIDYSLDETEQSVVDDYAKAIEEAINALKYKPADYTEYNKAVEKANALDRSLYKDLTDLDNALSVDVSGKNITEQAVVDKQAKAIEEAINALKYKPADYTEYNKAVEKANALDRSLYKDLTDLDNALSVDVSGKNITEQAVVDKQAKAIEEAINSLEYKPADYTAYNAAIEKANALDRSLYKDLTALDEALKTDVSGKNITEQSVVDEQTKAIEGAINALEYKPADYTAYNAAIEKANALDRSLYKDLTALDNALSVDVKDKNITEQEVVDEQTKAILEAIEKLEYKHADYSKLNSALAQVPEDLSIYTDESVKRLNSVIENLNYNLNVTEQDKADEQVEALLEAINALEKRYILGDVNLDGEITVLDAKWTLQYIAALRSLEALSLKTADMNQDGKISVLDAKLILIAVIS